MRLTATIRSRAVAARKGRETLLAAVLPVMLTQAVSAADAPMLGFSMEHAAAERTLEARFDAALDPSDYRTLLKTMAAGANHVGSLHDRANAELTLRLLKSWGWDARIESFQVLYPTPRDVSLEMVAPSHWAASMKEVNLRDGEEAETLKDALPGYNVYGADGEATAELVYVNYGTEDDYKELARNGVSVEGKIAIVRYGSVYRGLKPRLAAEHGAVACIIYSDPREDGYWRGEVYPSSDNRPPDAIQRGSVLDLSLYPGDPLTPGVGATERASRLAIADARTLVKIPALPISYADAAPLLGALRGAVAPPSWRGALPFTYHIGPGPARVHVRVASDWSPKILHDVIAVMRGTDQPEQWIIRGNHHDGWVVGARDPLSANVALMEEARAIGELAKKGWRPKRTLVYASWDGEEPGLLGSTEWAETHADELTRRAVLYVNTDSNERGFLGVGGTRSLQRLVNEVASEVKDPETGVTVGKRTRAKTEVDAYRSGAALSSEALRNDVVLQPLGATSDFTPFLEHLGIPSLDLGMGGDEINGLYHSSYDSFANYERFADPGFRYGVALSEVVGRLVLRTANADVLPFSFGDFANAVGQYVDEIRTLEARIRGRHDELARLLDTNAFQLAADPRGSDLPPQRQGEVPHIDVTPLETAVADLKRSAAAYDQALADRPAISPTARSVVNGLLADAERLLLTPGGLPSRSWYKHLVYAPGRSTGYMPVTVPGVREAIEQQRWDDARRYVSTTALALEAYAARLSTAAARLKGG